MSIKSFFYHPETGEIHKPKIVSIIVFAIALTGLFFYGKNKNSKLDEERIRNARYTVGVTIKEYRNFRSPNPTVKYTFRINRKLFYDFEEIPSSKHRRVNVVGGRYYVQYSFENIDNHRLLLDYPVPDSITNIPENGWIHMPGY